MPRAKCPWCGKKLIYLSNKEEPDKPIKESCPYCYGDVEIIEGTAHKKDVKPFRHF
jgi:predicted RNA-binding Zn-ribbon protein involved in translation (DUF1610 family)